MRLIKHNETLYIDGYGTINMYSTLKGTRFSIYIPHLSIMVGNHIIDAVIAYMQYGTYADMRLEEYLSKLY